MRRAQAGRGLLGLGLHLVAGWLCGPAFAQASPGTCLLPGLNGGPALRIGHVTDHASRVAFIKGSELQPGCPADTSACRDKAFLVAGNTVILAQAQGAFVCATYVGRSGETRSGWLPATVVAADPEPAVALGDWAGKWSQSEATITLKPSPPNTLVIKGDATWGALDPDRVKRGAVNIGSITGRVVPEGPGLSFTMGDTGTLPVTAGAAEDCRVWMRRIGADLLVDDNLKCGGMNVTFQGLYTRK